MVAPPPRARNRKNNSNLYSSESRSLSATSSTKKPPRSELSIVRSDIAPPSLPQLFDIADSVASSPESRSEREQAEDAQCGTHSRQIGGDLEDGIVVDPTADGADDGGTLAEIPVTETNDDP